MAQFDFRVPAHMAAQPRPQPPTHLTWWHREWIYYYEALACWLAMKADCLMDGVRDEPTD